MISCQSVIEKIVQQFDQTRIDVSRSFISIGLIVKIEICPDFEHDETYLDITLNKYLDWAYEIFELDDDDVLVGSETKTIKIKISDSLGNYEIFEKYIDVISEEEDKLYSTDSDIIAIENGIMTHIPDGRSSFINMHREAKKRIHDWLDEKGYHDSDGERIYEAFASDNVEEVRRLSSYLTLQLIFESSSNAIDDVFSVKAEKYSSMASASKTRSKFRVDTDADNEYDLNVRTSYITVRRR